MRVLIVGGGCRGLDLTRALSPTATRCASSRGPRRGRAAIEAAGGECWIGTPDVIGTLRYALENVTLAAVAARHRERATPDGVAALHGSRLRMMLEKTTDTTVRGVVYEAAGTVPREVLAQGVAEMRHAQRTNEIPFALVHADPRGDRAAWLGGRAATAIDGLLAGPRRVAPPERARAPRAPQTVCRSRASVPGVLRDRPCATSAATQRVT